MVQERLTKAERVFYDGLFSLILAVAMAILAFTVIGMQGALRDAGMVVLGMGGIVAGFLAGRAIWP